MSRSYVSQCHEFDYAGHARELYAVLDGAERVEHVDKMRREQWYAQGSGREFMIAFEALLKQDSPAHGPYRTRPQ